MQPETGNIHLLVTPAEEEEVEQQQCHPAANADVDAATAAAVAAGVDDDIGVKRSCGSGNSFCCFRSK